MTSPLSPLDPPAGYDLVSIPARELSAKQLGECYRMVRRIRGLYIAAGDLWDRHNKRCEMTETGHLQYHMIIGSNGELAGFVSYVRDDVDNNGSPTTFVYELHVARSRARSGLGTYLLQLVEHAAPGPVTLRTFRCNKPAVSFYLKNGFHIDQRNSDSDVLFMTRD